MAYLFYIILGYSARHPLCKSGEKHMKKQLIKAKNQKIVDYWFARVGECGLSVDAAEEPA